MVLWLPGHSREHMANQSNTPSVVIHSRNSILSIPSGGLGMHVLWFVMKGRADN